MKVVFRVDASIELGTGHVMRCLTLAEQLRENGAHVFFICRELNGDLINYIKNKGYNTYCLKNKKINTEINEQPKFLIQGQTVNWKIDALETIKILKQLNKIDWLVVDHYSLDKHWETEISPFVKNVLVIDDLANRAHKSDILLDQNFYFNGDVRYQYLLPSSCKLLVGPKFALLRNEFRHLRLNGFRKQGASIERIFICFGGSDPGNVTGKILRAIEHIKCDHLMFDVVVGISNKNKDEIKLICEKNSHFHYLFNTNNIAQIMSNADMCLVSGGSLTWERYCLGLVGGIITIAKNQEQLAQTVHHLNIDEYFGKSNELIEKKLITNIELLINTSANHLRYRRELAINLVDGNGVKRVIQEMNTFVNNLPGEM